MESLLHAANAVLIDIVFLNTNNLGILIATISVDGAYYSNSLKKSKCDSAT